MPEKTKYCMCEHEGKLSIISVYKESTCRNNTVRVQDKSYLEIAFEYFDSAPAKLTTIIGPYTFAPVTVTARLCQKQMVKGVAKTRFRRSNILSENFLVEQNARLLHRPKQFFVTMYPGDIVCPAAAFHMKPMVFFA